MLQKLKKHISLEPVIFLWAFGWSILNSAKVEKNLLIWKICHLELEYNETICNDLTSQSNTEIMEEVQIRLNNFEMVGQWLSSTPGVLYSFFVGSLSDDFGRKPCVYFPLLGATFGTIFSMINYIWIRELPTEFFYISGDFWCSVLGGSTVYYLGTYGYGASISKESKRASLLARFDAMELLGLVAGSLLSPITFKLLGYYGSFLTYFFCCLLTLIYLKCCVQEPVNSKEFRFKGFSKFLKTFLIKPVKEMFFTISKKRPGNLRFLLVIQLLAYGLLWFNTQWSYGLEYNYMLLVFKGFTADQYAYYSAAMQVLMSLFMLLVMPCIKVHESMYCVIALAPTAIAYFILPWITNLWAFFGVNLLRIAAFGAWASARSLFTFCVSKKEIGKIYASVGIVASIIPFASNPAFRQLYNHTIKTFPGAVLILAGCIVLIKIYIYLTIYFQRSVFDLLKEEPADHELDNETNVQMLNK